MKTFIIKPIELTETEIQYLKTNFHTFHASVNISKGDDKIASSLEDKGILYIRDYGDYGISDATLNRIGLEIIKELC